VDRRFERDASLVLTRAALDDTLSDLCSLDPRRVPIVELRPFGGEGITAVLGCSASLVKRDCNVVVAADRQVEKESCGDPRSMAKN
jgi:hypothetical protein